MSNDIIYKFNITYQYNNFHTQYAKLSNNKYAKTYIKNDNIETEFITEEEYNSALAHITLRNINP